jgi:hypothetical protein
MSKKAKMSNSVDFGYLNDKKMEKSKKTAATEMETMKGPSNKEVKAQEQERKAAMKKVAARQTERIPFKKKAMGICAVLFMCGVGLFQFLSTVFGFIMGNGIAAVDVKDTAALKIVLFGGDPYLVYCVNNETENQRLPQVLEDSGRNNVGYKIVLLRCWDQTESGRSVAQRFKLRVSPPLAFVVANGNSPRVVNLVGAARARTLTRSSLRR